MNREVAEQHLEKCRRVADEREMANIPRYQDNEVGSRNVPVVSKRITFYGLNDNKHCLSVY